MATQERLPPLHISQLSPVPLWEETAQYDKRTIISFALRHFNNLKCIAEKTITHWSVKIYRTVDRTRTVLESLASTSLTDSSGEDEEGTSFGEGYEYLIFLFKGALNLNTSVFVLSTSKAYKKIQSDCLMSFPRHCSARLSNLISNIQRISTSQVFGPATESSHSIQQSFPDIMNQSGLVCREFTAVGTGIKIKFKENGILIYKSFSLEQYLPVLEDLAPPQEAPSVFRWDIPGLPDGNLETVNDSVQKTLNTRTCEHLLGMDTKGWSFSLKLTERWYSHATQFRILEERRRYGHNSGGAIESWTTPLPDGVLSSDFDLFKKALQSNLAGYPIDKVTAPSLNPMLLDFLLSKRISIEYLSTDGHWYRNYLTDCIDGWARTDTGDVYFKLGNLWYQIRKAYVDLVRDVFQQVISTPGVVLTRGQAGYLHLPWVSSSDETTYNRSYIFLNLQQAQPMWFDGNQKFRSRVELFDILQVSGNNDIFIYHVKKTFGTHIREAVSQLVTSAQVIFNTRNTTYQHPDSLETWDYCKRVSTNNADQLFRVLKTGTLHFVLAFKSEGAEELSRSASLIAKREVITAKQEIEKLGFTFKISPIQKDS